MDLLKVIIGILVVLLILAMIKRENFTETFSSQATRSPLITSSLMTPDQTCLVTPKLRLRLTMTPWSNSFFKQTKSLTSALDSPLTSSRPNRSRCTRVPLVSSMRPLSWWFETMDSPSDSRLLLHLKSVVRNFC